MDQEHETKIKSKIFDLLEQLAAGKSVTVSLREKVMKFLYKIYKEKHKPHKISKKAAK